MQKITEQWTDVDESDPWAEGGAGVMEESLYFDELRSYEEKLYLDDPLDVKYFPKSNVPNTNIENTLEFNEGDARRIDAEKRIQYLYNWNSDKVLKDPIQPIIVEFRKLIESDNKLHMLFNAMLRYAGEDESYHRNPMGEIRKPDYKYLLLLFNAMLTRAPALHAEKNVFIPLRVVLRWSLSNAAGAAASAIHLRRITASNPGMISSHGNSDLRHARSRHRMTTGLLSTLAKQSSTDSGSR